MSFYAHLLAATSSERDALLALPILRDALAGRVTLDEYRRFLGQAYHHVAHTVPLLMACGSRLPSRLEWLREAVAEYIEEELGHQRWILDDIRAAGGDADEVASGTPLPETELMVAYAYDSIARGNPVAFFGMVLVLEGTSVTLATQAAGSLQQSLCLPRSAFRYLGSHGQLDQAHVGFYANLMDRLDDEHDRRAVVHAARMFYRLYAAIFQALRPALPNAFAKAA